jgi:hypothetical protein
MKVIRVAALAVLAAAVGACQSPLATGPLSPSDPPAFNGGGMMGSGNLVPDDGEAGGESVTSDPAGPVGGTGDDASERGGGMMGSGN